MQWTTGKCDGRVLLSQIAERVATGQEKQPFIREGQVTDRFATLWPIEHAGYAWTTDAENFSAIAHAFAYALFKELNVPVGILNCSFSQTSTKRRQAEFRFHRRDAAGNLFFIADANPKVGQTG